MHKNPDDKDCCTYPAMTTMSINLDVRIKIDLPTVAKYFVPDETLVLMHFRGMLKKFAGYKEPKIKKRINFFRNAATMVVRVDSNKYINIKTFGNGKFQITGCKSEDMAVSGMQTLLQRLQDMTGTADIAVLSKNNMLFDGDDIMGYNSAYDLVSVGYVTDQGHLFVNNERVVMHAAYPTYLLSSRSKQKRRNVYDLRGRKVGDITMSVKTFKHVAAETAEQTAYSEQTAYFERFPMDHYPDGLHTICTKYHALFDVQSLDIVNIRVTLINANMDIHKKMDRATFLSQAMVCATSDVRVSFDPQRNQGVKFFIGSCKAKMFQTGKVTILGASNYNDIDKVYRFVKDVLRYGFVLFLFVFMHVSC